MERKIDLVYLWVDDKDKTWQGKREYWAIKEGLKDTEENHSARFSNNDELKYSLRSAQMYAPWINQIFIITDNQVPQWLDANHPKIKIIDHKEIMDENNLPCFNSNALETCLDKIPELSEYFLYANDDMFFSAPVSPEDFFDKAGNPVINLRPRMWEKITNLHMQNLVYTTELFQTKYALPDFLQEVEPSHCIDAYRKSFITECKEIFAKNFAQTTNKKFRCENAVQRIIYSFYNYIKNPQSLVMNPIIQKQAYQEQVDNLYLNITPVNVMKMRIENLKPKLLCINDSPHVSDTNRKNLKQLLYLLFNETTKWEKTSEFKIQPVYLTENYRTIVFSFNNQYANYFGVTLQSIISNSLPEENYDIIVFNNDISPNNKRLLMSMLPSNFKLRFFDVLEFIQSNFNKIKLKTMNNWSIDMYYRIFIPLLMPDYKKVLYLDADTVVNSNLNELFEMDFEGKQIMAVKDTAVQVFHIKKNDERYDYIKQHLKFEDERNYFNSGMIYFNIPEINETKYREKVENAFKLEELLYPDQDILNLIFKDNVKLISSKWNFCCGDFVWNKSFLNLLTGEYLEDIEKAILNPGIIHYTSPRKPWNFSLDMLFEVFWKYARISPFYENILITLNKNLLLQNAIKQARYSNLYNYLQTDKNILLWGASIFLEEYLTTHRVKKENIIGIIDKNPTKTGTFIGEYQIYLPEDIPQLTPDEIILTIVNNQKDRIEEIKEYLNKHNLNNIEIKVL